MLAQCAGDGGHHRYIKGGPTHDGGALTTLCRKSAPTEQGLKPYIIRVCQVGQGAHVLKAAVVT